MKRMITLILFGLLLTAGRIWALPTFTDTFADSSYIQSATAYRSGGNLNIGYPYIYYHNNRWYYKWGDMAYYNDSLYVTWADDRYDGVKTVFVQKLSAVDGSLQWTTNFVLGEITNETFAPTVSVYDSSHVYVGFRRGAGGYARQYAARIDDSGASPTVSFYSQIDAGLSDNIHYYPWKSSSTVDAVGNFYVYTTWGYIGSGDRNYIQRVRDTGSVDWGVFQPINKYFSIGNELAYMDGNIYMAGEHWGWGSKDDGSFAQKMATNSSASSLWGSYKDIDGRDTIVGIMRYYGARNAVAVDTNNNVVYFAWSDRRSGNNDIYMTKRDTSGNAINWSPAEQGVISGAGDQESVNLSVLPSGDILMLYVDRGDSYKLKMGKVNRDDGSYSALTTGDSVDSMRPTTSYQPYNPIMVFASSNQIYIAFETSYSYDQVRVARFDYDGASLSKVWQKDDVQTVSYKIQSSMESKAVSFNSLVGSAKKIKLDATYSTAGGSVKFYLSADGQNFTNVQTNTEILFPTADVGSEVKVKMELYGDGSANPYIADYTVTATEYYTGNVLYGTSLLSLSGAGTLSVDPLNQTLTKKLYADGVNSNLFYLVITNQGNAAGDFYLTADSGSSTWSVKYYDGASDVTAAVTGPDGYLISAVGASGSHQINIVVTPSTAVDDGESYLIFAYVTAKPGSAVHDSVSFTSTALKYLPDIAVEHSGSLLTLGYLETDAATQQDSAVLNGRFYSYADISSNLLVISNAGVASEEVEISNWLTGTSSHWDVVYSNLTLGTVISSFPDTLTIPAGGFQVIGVGVRPQESAGVNETLDVGFFAKVTNGVAYLDSTRQDSGLFHYKAIQVQPDVMVSLQSNFTAIIGNDDYTYTNLNIYQTVTQRTINTKEIRYYVRIQNDGFLTEPILLTVSGITNSGWTETYLTNGVDVTTTLTNTGIWFDFSFSEYANVECRYTPDASVLSGDTPDVVVTAMSSNKNYVTDVLHLRPRSFRVKPDLMISTASNGTFLSNDVYAVDTSDFHGQVIYKRLEPGDQVTNYFRIQNDSTTDPDNMRVRGTGSDSHWTLNYQTTNAIGWFDVDSDLTNIAGYAQTLDVGQSRLFRVIEKAKTTAIADEVKNVVIETWSEWVTNERDTTLLSNIAVDLKPKIVVEGSDDGNYFTPDYANASVNVFSLSGVQRTYGVQIQNAGGSLEDYRFKITLQSFGGQSDDWSMSFLYITNNITNNLTTMLTNTGWISSFTNGEIKDLVVLLECTNIASTNAASSRGAVSNHISLNMDFSSETRSIRADKARLDLMIKRSIPDLEMCGVGHSTKNEVFPDYAATNFADYGIILKYENNYSVKVHNNFSLGSMDAEDMLVKAEVSNVTGTFGNWQWKFLDDQGNDVTIALTNGSYQITNLAIGSSKTFRFWTVNSNGIVHDKLIVKYEVKTKYQQVRSDHVWFDVEIVPGFPEIVGSYNGETRGVDQFAPDSFFLAPIESNETNHFVLMMSNTAPMFGYPWFTLNESVAGKTNFSVIYKTNGVIVPRADIAGDAFSNRIFNPQTNALPREIPLDVYVVPNGTIQSGDVFELGYKFYLTENANVYDSFTLSNRMVNPQVDTYFVTSPPTNYIHLYRKPGQSFGEEIRALNQDVVDGDYRLIGNGNTTILTPHYYSLVGSYSNEITSDTTNGGWLTNIRAGNFLRFGVKGSVSATAHSGERYTLNLKARSEKNSNRFDSVDYEIEVIDALPDIVLGGNGLNFGANQYMPFSPQSATDRIEYLETNVYTLSIQNDLSVGSNVQYVLNEDQVYQMNGYKISYEVDGVPISLPYSNFSLAAGQTSNVTVKLILTNDITSGSIGMLKFKVFALQAPDLYDSLSLYAQKVSPSVSIYDNSGKSMLSNYIQPGQNYLIRTAVHNNDSVQETMTLTANPSTSSVELSFLQVSGFLTNEITSDVTNGGYSLSVAGNSDEYVYMNYMISSNALSGDSLQTLFKATPSKNSSVFAIYTNYMEVIDSRPDLSLSNADFSDRVVGDDSYYPTDQALRDFMMVRTNRYVLRVENDIVAGSIAAFTLSELGRNNMDAYEVKYFYGGSEIFLSNYTLSLAAKEHRDLTVQVVLTNLSLASGSEGWLSFRQVCDEIPDSYDVVYLYTKKIQPQISLAFDDGTIDKVLWVTNKHKTDLNIKFANLDSGYNEPVFMRVYPGTNFNLSDPYDEFFSFTFTNIDGIQTNDLTAQITNTGWTSSALIYGDKKNLKFHADPLAIARTGSFVNVTLLAYPVHDTNQSKTVHLRLNLIDSHVDSQVSGGNLAKSIYGNDIYLPIEVVATDRIEASETNQYTFTIENDDPNSLLQPIKVYPSFEGKVSDFEVSFLTNGVSVDISNFVISLAGGDPGRPVTALVTPKSSAASGDSIKINLNIKMTNMPVFEDTVSLEIFKTAPHPELLVAGPFDRSWSVDSYKTVPRTFHTYKGSPFTFYMAARNQDVIWDDFLMKATNIVHDDIATNWKFEYIPFSATNRLPLDTTGLYLSNYQYRDYYITKVILTPVESASPDVNIDSIFTLQSLKDPAIVAVMTNKINVATGFITGRVADKKTDQPIEGAKITVQDNTGSKSQTYSTNDGTYAVRVYPLFNSQFEVKVEADNYIGDRSNFILQIETNVIDFDLVGLNMAVQDSEVRAFPNPTTSGQGAVFVYNVEGDDHSVLVEIYSMSGKLVRKLVDEQKNKGTAFIHWDGADENGQVVSRGLYIFFIRDGSKVVTRKLFVK